MPDTMKPCYMCNNARVDDELTDSCDLSYITIGDCDKGFRITLASGDGKPVRILLEHFCADRIWHLVGIYYPSYCPNCGRKLSEYDIGARGRAEGLTIPDELKPLTPLTAQEALHDLTGHFLGEDWYVVDPLGVNQVNAIIVDEIKRKYPKRRRFFNRRVGCEPAGEHTASNRPQDGSWRVGEGEKDGV